MDRFRFEPDRYPEEPGCYLMFDQSGQLLYVGKAVNLRRRLCSYFQFKPDRPKVAQLVQEIADIEIMIVRNENESLTLETNLIQYYKPPYNRAKKRESSVYPYIAVTQERVPRLLSADRERQAPRASGESGGERLIGPFPNPVFRNYALEFVIDNYRLRTCEPLPSRLCMRYYLGKCGGICELKETEEQYDERMYSVLQLLSDPGGMPGEMEKAMEALSERLQFEKAKDMYVRLNALRSMLDDQAVNVPRDHHQLAVFFGSGHLLAARIEYGMLRTRFICIAAAPEWVQRLIFLLPDKGPIEIVTNDMNLAEPLVQMAQSRRLKVKAAVPAKGKKLHMLNICERNLIYRLDDSTKTNTNYHNPS
ncbi:MAG: excinuclease subunit [Paenibacillus sp.]|nr:excinuclease subunit [Paenibacillus sp.]